MLAVFVAGRAGTEPVTYPVPKEAPVSPERFAASIATSPATATRYGVMEVAVAHPNAYANPFLEADLSAEFTAPSGRRVAVAGFHDGGIRQETWKIRFAPDETGRWSYAWKMADRSGGRATGSGAFECLEGRRRLHGFMRRHPSNPFRWVLDDGRPFFPVGLQECAGDGNKNGSVLDQMSLEGPFRTDLKNPPPLPKGPVFRRGPSSNPVNADVYFRRYAQAGFNLFRFSQANCSFDLYQDPDRPDLAACRQVDELLGHVRRYGFKVMYGIFGYKPVFNQDPGNAGIPALNRFVAYSVARWGAYVDVWEFLNEQDASDGWYAAMAPVLRSIDPYGHPITTSWERPQLAGMEVNAPHWYEREDELASDAVTANNAAGWKKHGKPVIVGEQGNTVDPKKPRPPGVGGVWDDKSEVRMRIRLWTALFSDISLMFWNTSYARDGHFMNIWLGPREREAVRALQTFAVRLDRDVLPVVVEVSAPEAVRAYGLASAARTAVYLHHFGGHASPQRGLKVTLDLARGGRACWYDPATGGVPGTFEVVAGRQILTAPDFKVDLAFLVAPEGAPDSDGDGLANDVDPDDDNDGVPDARDAFPLESEEWADRDGDLIGDVLDADDDGDGVPDDGNRNGIPDFKEMDLDGDGVPSSGSIPWDAFPEDPKRWQAPDDPAPAWFDPPAR